MKQKVLICIILFIFVDYYISTSSDSILTITEVILLVTIFVGIKIPLTIFYPQGSITDAS